MQVMQQSQATVIGIPPPPVVVQYQAPVRTPRIYDNLACTQTKVLGVIQIICGGLAILFNIIGFPVEASLAVVGQGFWCGCFYIIAGGFGIGAAKHKTMCMIVTCMTMSIFASVMTIPLLTVAAIGLSMDSDCSSNFYTNFNCVNNQNPAGQAMNALLLIISIVEAIVSIWQSALCCAAVCCCAPRQTQPQAPVTAMQYAYSPATGWQASVFTPAPNAPVTYILPSGQQALVMPTYSPGAVGPNVPIYPSTTSADQLPAYSGSTAPPPYTPASAIADQKMAL